MKEHDFPKLPLWRAGTNAAQGPGGGVRADAAGRGARSIGAVEKRDVFPPRVLEGPFRLCLTSKTLCSGGIKTQNTSLQASTLHHTLGNQWMGAPVSLSLRLHPSSLSSRSSPAPSPRWWGKQGVWMRRKLTGSTILRIRFKNNIISDETIVWHSTGW